MTTETMERTHTGEMATLDKTGDTKIMWDRDNADEVANARESFNRLTRDNKYAAFHVTDKEGKKGEPMRTFDPNAERIILVPQLRGG